MYRGANDNDDPTTTRLICIIWDMPPDGQTRQAALTTPIGGLMTVPAHGHTTVQPTADCAGRCPPQRPRSLWRFGYLP